MFEQDDYVDARAELKAAELFDRKQKAIEEKMSERERKLSLKTAKAPPSPTWVMRSNRQR